MTFSEYAQGLFPYCSYGKSESDFVTEILGNFVDDAAMDACKILKRFPDTKYRYYTGKRAIPQDQAQYLFKHRNTEKYSKWIWDRMDESDSYEKVCNWLEKLGIEYADPSVACADLLETILLDIINGASHPIKPIGTPNPDLELISEIEEKIKSLPRPAAVPVPKEATNDEQMYIDELYRAYGDATGIDSFSSSDFDIYPEYGEDLEDRRIDFYAAESIRRGVMELGGGGLSDQFDVLKDETLNGVKDTARRQHPNGYECMLAVMEQAVNAPVTDYLLSQSPYWISGKIKKGVCHHLVNDNKLRWVRRTKK